MVRVRVSQATEKSSFECSTEREPEEDKEEEEAIKMLPLIILIIYLFI